jgi:hypothetical protein
MGQGFPVIELRHITHWLSRFITLETLSKETTAGDPTRKALRNLKKILQPNVRNADLKYVRGG